MKNTPHGWHVPSGSLGSSGATRETCEPVNPARYTSLAPARSVTQLSLRAHWPPMDQLKLSVRMGTMSSVASQPLLYHSAAFSYRAKNPVLVGTGFSMIASSVCRS